MSSQVRFLELRIEFSEKSIYAVRPTIILDGSHFVLQSPSCTFLHGVILSDRKLVYYDLSCLSI